MPRTLQDLQLERLVRLHTTEWDSLTWAYIRREHIQSHYVGFTDEHVQWIWNNKKKENSKYPFIAASKSLADLKKQLDEYGMNYRKQCFEALRKVEGQENMSDNELIETLLSQLPCEEKFIREFLRNKETTENEIRGLHERNADDVIPMSTFYKPHLSEDIVPMVKFCETGNCSTCMDSIGRKKRR